MVQWGVSEKDLEKCTLNPIEEPEFDDCFADIIKHIKEDWEKHQLRKETSTFLLLFHLLLLTTEEVRRPWVDEEGFELKWRRDGTTFPSSLIVYKIVS